MKNKFLWHWLLQKLNPNIQNPHEDLMIIRKGNPLNALFAQGSALGDRTFKPRPERAKALVGSKAFALSGRWRHTIYTQGVLPA